MAQGQYLSKKLAHSRKGRKEPYTWCGFAAVRELIRPYLQGSGLRSIQHGYQAGEDPQRTADGSSLSRFSWPCAPRFPLKPLCALRFGLSTPEIIKRIADTAGHGIDCVLNFLVRKCLVA